MMNRTYVKDHNVLLELHCCSVINNVSLPPPPLSLDMLFQNKWLINIWTLGTQPYKVLLLIMKKCIKEGNDLTCKLQSYELKFRLLISFVDLIIENSLLYIKYQNYSRNLSTSLYSLC